MRVSVTAVVCLLTLVSGLHTAHSTTTDTTHGYVHNDDFVAAVNREAGSWEAHNSPRFAGVTWDDAAKLCGTYIEEPTSVAAASSTSSSTTGDFPSSFDVRTQWPGCVGIIENQQLCGACWAFATTEVLADRMCVQNGVKDIQLSPQRLISCDSSEQSCEGGTLSLAWDFLADQGGVQGECFKYASGTGKHIPSCPSTLCPDASVSTPARFFAKKDTLTFGVDETGIMAELQKYGPVATGFTAYEDLYSYKSGVYAHTKGKKIGGHAVKIVGWGEQDGIKYWSVANSWGTSWGEKGYFKIVRGVNECGIESGSLTSQFGYYNGTIDTDSAVTWPAAVPSHNAPADLTKLDQDVEDANTAAKYIVYAFCSLLGLLLIFVGQRFFQGYLAIASVLVGTGVAFMIVSMLTHWSETVQAVVSVAGGFILTIACTRFLYVGFFFTGVQVAFVLLSLVVTLSPVYLLVSAHAIALCIALAVMAAVLGGIAAGLNVRTLPLFTSFTGGYMAFVGGEFFVSALAKQTLRAHVGYFTSTQYAVVAVLTAGFGGKGSGGASGDSTSSGHGSANTNEHSSHSAAAAPDSTASSSIEFPVVPYTIVHALPFLGALVVVVVIGTACQSFVTYSETPAKYMKYKRSKGKSKKVKKRKRRDGEEAVPVIRDRTTGVDDDGVTQPLLGVVDGSGSGGEGGVGVGVPEWGGWTRGDQANPVGVVVGTPEREVFSALQEYETPPDLSPAQAATNSPRGRAPSERRQPGRLPPPMFSATLDINGDDAIAPPPRGSSREWA